MFSWKEEEEYVQWQLTHLPNFFLYLMALCFQERNGIPQEGSRESGVLMGERLEQGGDRNVQVENRDYGCWHGRFFFFFTCEIRGIH